MAAISQYPWRGSSFIRLANEQDPILMVREAADICEIPLLSTLPPELACRIGQQLSTTTFRRFWSALKLLDALDIVDQRQVTTARLADILSWKRGQALLEIEANAHPGSKQTFTRLTLDALGIRCIERLDRRPYNQGRTNNAAFIVEPTEALRDIIFSHQVGLPLFVC